MLKPSFILRSIFRTSYDAPATPISWFPGHMAKGLKNIEALLPKVDILIEARDARVPLSSINPRFESLIKGYQTRNRDRSNKLTRVIVYNKMDLITKNEAKIIQQRFKPFTSDPILFTAADSDFNIKPILDIARSKASEDSTKYPFLKVLVVGMPNVGKSSLINALRRVGVNKGKAAMTGGQPGLTKAIGTTIKVWNDPAVYLIDSPGVMIPHIPDPMVSLKVALTGGIKDHLADEQVLCDFLLYTLNSRGFMDYSHKFGLTSDSVIPILNAISNRAGFLHPGGLPDLAGACHFFLKRYRTGKLGTFVLDDISQHEFDRYHSYLKLTDKQGQDGYLNQGLVLSKGQIRKEQKKVQLDKILKKRIGKPKPKF